MAITDLIRTYDAKLGPVYVTSATPVTFTDSSGTTELIAVDGASMPDATLMDPWMIKYKVTDVQQNNPHGYFPDFLKAPLMDVIPQYSDDSVAWTNFDNWSFPPYTGQMGTLQYNLTSAIGRIPRYIRVVARIYPNADGDTTATILMGMKNYAL